MTPHIAFAAWMILGAPPRLERHDIDSFPAGYQVAVADLNRDGRPDVIALSTEADRVDWYENPRWERRAISRTPKNIDVAPRDLDGDGIPEIALASGFYFSEAERGGEIAWLSAPTGAPVQPGSAEPWKLHPIAVDPVVHRLRWGDLDGDGRPELVHAPLFGRGSAGAKDPKPAHLWAFAPPRDLAAGTWEIRKIDDSLTVLHGIHVSDLDGDGRDEVLTASFEGIHRLDLGKDGAWKKVRIGEGAEAVITAAGPSRGASEVAPGKLGPKSPFIAAVEPWHGSQVVVYTPPPAGGTAGSDSSSGGERPWARRVIDEGLSEGHAVVVVDLDRDGIDEIVAGWRGTGGGLALYTWKDGRFERSGIARDLAVEGAAAADLDGDGDPDLAVIAGRSNILAWYENHAEGPSPP